MSKILVNTIAEKTESNGLLIDSSIIFSGKAINETALLGAELLDSTGWTSTGWTGDFATGFIHTPGNTSALSRALVTSGTKMYHVVLTVDSPLSLNNFTISIGNSIPFVMYEGTFASHTYYRGIKSVSDGDFVITPESTFDGTITSISVKEVTGATSPTLAIKDSGGNSVIELRQVTNTLTNLFFGKNTGRYNVSGKENVSVGNNSLAYNISGFWNVAAGTKALENNINGTRNVSVGYLTLQANISGHRNVALGSMALMRNTHGINNIGIGADSLWYNTTGNYNIGIGIAAVGNNISGNNNIGIGQAALPESTTASDNIAIGNHALNTSQTGDYNIAIGYQALYTSNGAAKNIAIGYNTAQKNTTGASNLAFGDSALQNNTTGEHNIAIGYYALSGAANAACSYNVGIGDSVMSAITTGLNNVCLGTNSEQYLTSGANNIAIGIDSLKRNQTGSDNVAIGNAAGGGAVGSSGVLTRTVCIGYHAGQNLTTNGNYNVLIGGIAGGNLTTGSSNIIIGYNVSALAADSSNTLNIGNTIYGNLGANKQIGINVTVPTAHLHLPAGAAGAGLASLKIDAGTLQTTPEAGAIEFDGTNLYFTNASGERKTIAVTA